MCSGGGDSSNGGDFSNKETPMTGYKPGDVQITSLAPPGSNTQQHNPHTDTGGAQDWGGDVDEHNNSRGPRDEPIVDTRQEPKVSGNPGKDIFATPTEQPKSSLMGTIGNAIVNTLAFAAGGPVGLGVVNAGRAMYGAQNPNSAIGISVPEAIGNTVSGGLLSKGKIGQAALTSIAGNMASGKNLANPQDPNSVRGALSNMTDIGGNFQGFGNSIMGGINSAPISGGGTTNPQNLGMIHSQPVVGTKNNIGDIPGLIQQRNKPRNEFGKIFN